MFEMTFEAIFISLRFLTLFVLIPNRYTNGIVTVNGIATRTELRLKPSNFANGIATRTELRLRPGKF